MGGWPALLLAVALIISHHTRLLEASVLCLPWTTRLKPPTVRDKEWLCLPSQPKTPLASVRPETVHAKVYQYQAVDAWLPIGDCGRIQVLTPAFADCALDALIPRAAVSILSSHFSPANTCCACARACMIAARQTQSRKHRRWQILGHYRDTPGPLTMLGSLRP